MDTSRRHQSRSFGSVLAQAGIVLAAITTGSAVQAQVVVGGDVEEGFVKVRSTASADQLVFEVDGNVQVGRGGSATEAVDTDFYVYDPNYVSSPTEPSLSFDASFGILRLGSGDAGEPGEGGDVQLEDGSGARTIFLDGASAWLRLGTTGEDGDLTLRNAANITMIRGDGESGDVTNNIASEGLVKGWCRVDLNGDFIDGWRCTNDSNFPTRSSTGVYRVDMTPLSTDLNSRPYVVSCSSRSDQVIACAQVLGQVLPSDLSVVSVGTRNPLTGNPVDSPFTIVFY